MKKAKQNYGRRFAVLAKIANGATQEEANAHTFKANPHNGLCAVCGGPNPYEAERENNRLAYRAGTQEYRG